MEKKMEKKSNQFPINKKKKITHWTLVYRKTIIVNRAAYALCAGVKNKLIKENPTNYKKTLFEILPIN